MLCVLQARLGLPTGRADVGLEPCGDSVTFLRRLRRDFEKVRSLLELVVSREKMKCDQVSFTVTDELNVKNLSVYNTV